jgi:hypothetical protein
MRRARPAGNLKAEIIETARLVLEPLRIEHAEPMAIVLADPQLHTFIGGAPATARQLRHVQRQALPLSHELVSG